MDRFLVKKPKIYENIIEQEEDNLFISSCENDANHNTIHSESSALEIPEYELIENEPDKAINKKNYPHKFRDAWKLEFPWITNKNGHAYCSICNTTLVGSAFHLKRHEKSDLHNKRFNAARKTVNITNMFNKESIEANTSLSIKIKEAELKICAFLCENNLPISLSDELSTFISSTFTDSTIAKAIKLKRKKATNIIVNVLAPESKRTLVQKLQNTNFSLVIDETTDISTKKSLVVISRFWNEQEHKVTDKFFDLLEVDSCTANALFKSIKNLLDENSIPYKNLIGFAADNASVMMGQHRGVQALFKEICPNIIVQGCSCHSLHLCASSASKELPNNIEQFARDIYSYFSNSSRRQNEFREHEVFLNEKPTKLLYPSQTRWLSLKLVTIRILEHWESLTLYFQKAVLEENLPTAKAILGALHNPIYKLYFLFLSYVLELITTVNIEMQSEAPKIPYLFDRITYLSKNIMKSFMKKDVLLKPLDTINVKDPNLYRPLEDIYFGAKADAFVKETFHNFDKTELHNFKLHVLQYYVELVNQLKSRFNFKGSHFQYARNFAPEIALSGDVLSIAEFVNMFPNVTIDIELANIEWQLLSETPRLKQYFNKDVTEFWKIVSQMKNGLDEPMFENLMIIVKVILALPHSSATAERAFSQLNLIKTKIRNQLQVSTCAAILHVKNINATHPSWNM